MVKTVDRYTSVTMWFHFVYAFVSKHDCLLYCKKNPHKRIFPPWILTYVSGNFREKMFSFRNSYWGIQRGFEFLKWSCLKSLSSSESIWACINGLECRQLVCIIFILLVFLNTTLCLFVLSSTRVVYNFTWAISSLWIQLRI